MMSVFAKRDFLPDIKSDQVLVECPECKQKLAGIDKISGNVFLRIKCRRCKNYILIKIEE